MQIGEQFRSTGSLHHSRFSFPSDDGLWTRPTPRLRLENTRATWRWEHPSAVRLEVRLVSEEQGGFSAYLPSLPGAVSDAETEAEALHNVREAVAGLLASYRERNQAVPWIADVELASPGETSRWITVEDG